MNIDDVFEFYRDEFLPSYSDLVGYIADKPMETLIELENAFTHISQYFNPKVGGQDKSDNISKAYDHLVRATLDCYKLLWASIYEQLEATAKDKFMRKLGLNISEAAFLTKFQEFRKLAQEARGIEMRSVGLDPLAPIDKYKELVGGGSKLVDVIDVNKMREIRSLKRFISTKEFIIGIITGLIAGLVSDYVLHLLFIS